MEDEHDLKFVAEEFEINNRFWFYLFHFGTALGGEMFYSLMFPCWFWNIDGAVGRRIGVIWCLSMYIGNLKMNKTVFNCNSDNVKILKLQRPGSERYNLLASACLSSCHSCPSAVGPRVWHAFNSRYGQHNCTICSTLFYY